MRGLRHIPAPMEQNADLPLRQITRLRTELAIAAAKLTGEMFPDQPLLGIEWGIAARISLPDWTASGVVAPPRAPTRWITVRRMALSLGNPPETTRRHVHLLVERGALVLSDDGVALAATATNEALAFRYFRKIHDLFIRLIEGIAATTDLDFALGERPAFGVEDVIERALEVLLLPIDQRPLPNRLSLLLWGALAAAAVQHVTYDPVLARRYAHDIPDDAVREAVPLRRIATLLSVPYATAWRQFQALHRAGLVTRVGADRWTVLTANFTGGGMRDITGLANTHLLRKVRELALLGLDPARAAEHYLAARPAPVDFGLSQNG